MASDESIFVRIAAGEPGAVSECMTRHGPLVWSLARSSLKNAADAEDATQEIFVELWKSAARFNPNAGSDAVFIRTIARRKLIDRLRAQGRQPVTEEFDEASFLPTSDELGENTSVLDGAAAAHALDRLDAGQRGILLMGVVEGMTHSEIAQTTGKPLGTVKAQLRRGLIKMRALLEEREGAQKKRQD